MLKNYFKIAFRNLYKHKAYSLINIFGLAVGIACCVLITLYIHNEWSYDQFHSKADRIYRSWVKEDYGEGDVYFNTETPIALKPALEQNIPEIEAVTRRYVLSDLVKRSEGEQGYSQATQVVDPSFFSIFDFELLHGEKSTIFSTPDQVVLTPSSAERYFGREDPLQKTILIKIGKEFEPFTVVGILEEAPSNSSIQFDMLIPFSNSPKLFSEGAHRNWYGVAPETYVILNGQADPDAARAKLPGMMKQILGEEEYANTQYTVGLQPLTDIHLNTDFPVGIAPVSDPTYSYILAAIALLVLVIACANFMTLSVSRSTSRAREVGIRKTIGAQRQHLMYQFWGEALLMTSVALALGVILAEILLPMFNTLSGTELDLTFGTASILWYVLMAIVISLVAGIYPALILSGFRPAEVLKGKPSLKADKSLFRKGMVVFQFTLSIFFIASTLIVSRQLDFLRSKDLGYQKEHMVIIQTDATLGPNNGFIALIEEMNRKKDLLENELASQNGILEVAASEYTPAQPQWIRVDYRDLNGRKHEMSINFMDENYLQAMGIELTRGRYFSEEVTSDRKRAVIVNEALVDDFGWENPIGQRLPGDFEDHEIVGVMENFNYESLYSDVKPLAVSMNPVILLSGIDNINISSESPRITLKIASADVPSTMDTIRAAWERIAPAEPFNFTFLDQAVDSQYRQEERLSKIVSLGSSLAIIIACLGLFGLAALMVVRRTKEIGVRKVLGASTSNIVYMINKEFAKLIAIAFLLAVPFSLYAVSLWLQDFAYQVEFGFSVFMLAGLIALGVSWLTVSYHAIRAALIDPVNSLKSE